MSQMRFRFRLFLLLFALTVAALSWKPIGRRLDEKVFLQSEILDESSFQNLVNNSPDKAAMLIKVWQTGKIPHRQAVVRFLRESADPSVFSPASEKILVAAARDGDSGVREIALAALASRKSPLLLPLIASQIRDPDPSLRLLALDYARNQPTNAAMVLIGPVLDDGDPIVASTAAVALQKLGGQDFGIRVAQVLGSGLNSETREAFEARRAQAKHWWVERQKSLPSIPAAELPSAEPTFEVSDFTLQDLNGKTVRLSDFRGKIVLLNFWTTWCTACNAEFPILNDLQKKHASDLVILGISLDGVADDHGHVAGREDSDSTAPDKQSIQREVSSVAAARNLNYRILLDSENKVGARFNGGELPTNVLIDRSGRFSRRFIGARTTAAFEAMISAASQP